MKKVMSMFLVLVMLVMVVSGCSKVKDSGTQADSTKLNTAVLNVDANQGETSDGIFVWEGTVITDLTDKGLLEENIVIPDKATEIGEHAFLESKVVTVTMGDNVTKIDEDAFFSCIYLKSINIPDTVESIGSSAFYQCKSLESITIPASVKVIGEDTFYLCLALTSVTFNEGLTEIGETAFGCTSVATITLPEGLTTLGDRAFDPCPDTTNIYLPESLTSVGSGAFGLDYYAVINVKEGSWADKNSESFIP